MASSPRITGHTLATPHHSVTEAIRLFAESGLDGAELIWQDDYLSGIPESGNRNLLREIRSISADLGQPVVGLTPYMIGLNSPDPSTRQRDIERFQACIADAATLAAHVVRVYAGEYTPDDYDRRSELWKLLQDSLLQLAPIAEQHGVTLVVENHFNTMTMTARETVDLVEELDHPAIGILYDQANLTFTHSEDFAEAMDLQAGRIRHVHAKDLVFVDRNRAFSASAVANVTGGERAVRSRVLGTGELPWARIIQRLLADDYAGAISLEYEYRWHPQDLPDPREGLRRGAETLRAFIADSITTTEGATS